MEASRFIPACAGNRPRSGSLTPRSPVHPRVCGEQTLNHVPLSLYGGSSPRVRGTGGELTEADIMARFIPACAGNSALADQRYSRGSVHPRVCGEQRKAVFTMSRIFGSSPRVRGTDYPASARHLFSRFIPACAGNSCSTRIARAEPTVHPRVCGEQLSMYERRHAESGSSPRVRGTAVPEIRPLSPFRFIPACAGNSQRETPHRLLATVHPRVCGEQLDAKYQ